MVIKSILCLYIATIFLISCGGKKFDQQSSTMDFKTRYRLPKGTDSISLSVMNAIATQ